MANQTNPSAILEKIENWDLVLYALKKIEGVNLEPDEIEAIDGLVETSKTLYKELEIAVRALDGAYSFLRNLEECSNESCAYGEMQSANAQEVIEQARSQITSFPDGDE